MIKNLEFTLEEGRNSSRDVVVYALSTCGFCRRALKFLRDNSIAFRFLYMDHLPIDVKNKLKLELKEKYDQRIVYPFMILDAGEQIITGYKEDEWKEIFFVN
ncbi:MAG: glutaredoxin family protein [Candidatus Hodarchaeales archaeon]|jgi:arsenate reductase-like glutaredoxin family protein